MTVPGFDRITIEPGKLGGKPCIRRMRISVRQVLSMLGSYPDRAAILAQFPDLEEADFDEVLQFAASILEHLEVGEIERAIERRVAEEREEGWS